MSAQKLISPCEFHSVVRKLREFFVDSSPKQIGVFVPAIHTASQLWWYVPILDWSNVVRV